MATWKCRKCGKQMTGPNKPAVDDRPCNRCIDPPKKRKRKRRSVKAKSKKS